MIRQKVQSLAMAPSQHSSVAVLSDVHGVLPALEAALAEPEVRTADHIVLAGDHLAGPQPVETLERLRELGDRASWVRGNADRELVQLAWGEGSTIPDPIAPWAADQLRPEDVELLAGLPTRQVLEVEGFGRVVFCHATPRDDEEVVLVDSRFERWAEVFADLESDVATVVCGHTHMPYVRLVDRRTVVNPGSIGMPYGSVGAHWALLRGGTVSLHRAAYDIDAACDAVASRSTYPAAAEWADFFLHARASDVEALETFGPRDGRAAT